MTDDVPMASVEDEAHSSQTRKRSRPPSSSSAMNLTLFCCIVGDDTPFEVDISSSLTIHRLKEAIKEKIPNELKGIDPLRLDLFNVSLPYRDDLAKQVKDKIKQEKPLVPVADISEFFPGVVPKKTIHIAVKLPDAISSYGLPARESIAKSARRREAPSTGAKISTLRKIQTSSRKDAVFNNRPLSLSAPPITIYHPVFTNFLSTMAVPLESIDFSHDELESAFNFITAANDFYAHGDQRREAYSVIEKAVDKDILNHTTIQFANGQSILPDGRSMVPCPLLPGGSFGLSSAIEVKSEVGEGDSDPIAQAECDYVAVVTSEEYRPARELSCCPAFLIGLPGPYLTVNGAVFADKLISQRLTPGYIYLGPRLATGERSGLDEGVRQVAQVLRAIKNGLVELEDFYRNLKRPSTPSGSATRSSITSGGPSTLRIHPKCFPPHFQEYSDGKDIFQLTYTERLAPESTGKAVFKARLESRTSKMSTAVVVKFTNAYCEKGHKILESKSLAPALRFCQRVDAVGMFVVVMDFVEGKPVEGLIKDAWMVRSLREALKALHEKDLVFGDLRAPNVLVNQANKNVVLVDFDWCGPAGVVRYPADINLDRDIGWHNDVQRGGKIQKEYDEHLFNMLTGERL